MKKTILSTIIAISVLSLTGCFDKDNKENLSATSTSVKSQESSEKLSLSQITKNKTIFNDIIKDTSHITYGKSDSPIIVFFDPQCPHCHDLFEVTQKEEFKSQEFIWIPVAFLNQNSSVQAATILSSENPDKTFIEHEKIYSQNKFGIQPISIISKEVKEKVEKNNQVFEDTKFTGVPVMIKVSKSGNLEAVPGGVPIQYVRDFIKK